MTHVAVLGTGMAGFGAGFALECAKVPFACYDRNPFYGGHTRALRYPGGFVFDEGGHLSFTRSERIRELLATNVGGRFEERQLKIDNYWHGLRIPHPVQCNLRQLPTDLVVKVISDFVGAPGAAADANQSYAQWLHRTYGRTFAETFPIVYGHKYHTTTMDRLTTDWIGPRMYRPSVEEILRGALGGSVEGAHYVDKFRYPSEGGFVSYLEPFARRFPLCLDHHLVRIQPKERVLAFRGRSDVPYKALVSSVPLPDLVPMIEGVPPDVASAARRLAFTQAVLVNLAVNRRDLSETAITYFYDEDVIFSRVNLPHMFSDNNAPPGTGLIQAEVYFSDKYRPLTQDPSDYIEPVVRDLRRCGFLRDDDVLLLQDAVLNRYANVIYDTDRAAAVATIHAYLSDVGIHYCGRYGDWDHAWTDQAFESGEKAVRRLLDSNSSLAS